MYLGIITKISKLCNLRCTYCYEMTELGNSARMSLDQIGSMYRHLAEYFEDWSKPGDTHTLEFVWHGGEPFAQPISYWERVLDLQPEVFGETFARDSIRNTVQTNLTLVTEAHLPLLRRFRVGFSYDVLNGMRVTAGGRPTGSLVERKVEWLRSEGIDLGGIAVISRHNIAHPETIASYFLDRRIPFRALNIYEGKDELAGARDAALSFAEYLEFFRKLWSLPRVQKALVEGMSIDPLSTLMQLLNRRRNSPADDGPEERRAHLEWLLAVNTNGDVYSPGDCYHSEFRYGNIFEQPLDEIFYLSEGRERRIQRSLERFRDCCEGCAFFGRGCDGTYVSHATPEDAEEFRANRGCYFRALGEWVESKGAVRVRVGCRQGAAQVAQEDEPAPLETLYLNLTYRCNSDCLFCAADVRYKEQPRAMKLEEISALMGNRRFRRIELSGGEPTVHPQILEIARLSREHSESVVLLTHGRQLQNLSFARRILAAGVNFLVIPLYGASAEAHDRITNAPGSFAQTVKGFLNLASLEREYPFWVELKMLLTHATVAENRAIYRFARDTFPQAFHQISICPLIYSQSTLDYRADFSASFAELRQELWDLAGEIRRDGEYTLRLGEFPPCFFDSSELRALAHPALETAAPAMTYTYADENSPGGQPIDANPRFNGGVPGNAMVGACRSCRYDSYCGGLRSPYFSAAYLKQHGVSEFTPVFAPAGLPAGQ